MSDEFHRITTAGCITSTSITQTVSTTESERVIVDVDSDHSIDGPTWVRIMLAVITQDVSRDELSLSGFVVDPDTNIPDYNNFRLFRNVRKSGYRLVRAARLYK